MKTLKPHQEKGVEYLLNRVSSGRGGYLYMEMRTGKTLTTLRALKEITDRGLHNPWPLLILCPKTVMYAWLSELIEDGFHRDRIAVCNGTMKQAEEILFDPEFSIVIMNYDKVVKTDALRSRDWGGVIYDESIKISSAKANITKDCMSYRTKEYVFKVALSGAPAGEGFSRLVAPALAVDGEFCEEKNYLGHMLRYWRYNEYTYSWSPRRGTNEMIDTWLSENTYRVKQSDAGIVGEKLYSVQLIPATKWQTNELTHLWSLEKYRSKEGKLVEFNHLTRHTFEHLISQGIDWQSGELVDKGKTQAIVEYAYDLGAPCLIFCRFVEQVKMLATQLRELGVPVWEVTGAVAAASREEYRSEFQKARGSAAFIAQVTTVKMGIDLSNADTILYASNSFSFDDRAQSESRATHLHKSSPVQIVDFVTENTLEKPLLDLLGKKEDWNNRAMTAYSERRIVR